MILTSLGSRTIAIVFTYVYVIYNMYFITRYFFLSLFTFRNRKNLVIYSRKTTGTIGLSEDLKYKHFFWLPRRNNNETKRSKKQVSDL